MHTLEHSYIFFFFKISNGMFVKFIPKICELEPESVFCRLAARNGGQSAITAHTKKNYATKMSLIYNFTLKNFTCRRKILSTYLLNCFCCYWFLFFEIQSRRHMNHILFQSTALFSFFFCFMRTVVFYAPHVLCQHHFLFFFCFMKTECTSCLVSRALGCDWLK